MSYSKREFIQEAAIQIGAAMVKVMDEQHNGIIDNPDASAKLADNASNIAIDLADKLEDKYECCFDEEIFDQEA